jgi:RNA polymerase sigma-70 factor (ECF subfamily)
LRACVQALPTKQQQVIYLRFFADDSLEGIAVALGCSVGTVKSRLFHALDRLRRMNTLGALAADSKSKAETL